MIAKKLKQAGILFIMAVLIAAFMGGCAVTGKKAVWGDPETGLILTYRMEENRSLQYKTASSQDQKLEIMGQTNSTTSTSTLTFSVKPKGLKENDLLLGISIDGMKIDIKSAMGDMTPDLKSVVGKEFEMTLSALGKETVLPGAESLTYKIGIAGERSIDSSFNSIFPDLSDKPVKVGESWTTRNDSTEKNGSVTINVAVDNVNTLEGLETIDGMECVKIAVKTTGTMKGKGQQMGQDIIFKGDIKGSSTWYFAYKEGIFVKSTGLSTSKGAVEIAAQNMTIPMATESRSEINLIK